MTDDRSASPIDALRGAGHAYASRYTPHDTPRPRRRVSIVACMDARLDLFGLFGLQSGDAHLIRNAGGVVTDDVIRSLAISQRKLGTRTVLLVHHTDCGQLSYTDDQLRDELRADTGLTPTWAPESFTDVDVDLHQSLRRVRSSPFLPHTDDVHGFVFHVEDGTLRGIEDAA